MKPYTVFVSSSDAYSDIWHLFFDLFKKYWPTFDGLIVLNTEELEYSRNDLNILCTRVGKRAHFGETLRAGLDHVKTDNVLLFMIDYAFMGQVDCKKLEDYYNYFLNSRADSLCLIHQNYPLTKPCSHPELLEVCPPAPNVMFSYQAAFWKKSILREMALPHENPWMSEWFGSLRATKMKIKLLCPVGTSGPVIKYDPRGCLHRGKWLTEAVDFLRSIDYDFDYSRRGYYSGEYKTLRYRIEAKLTIYSTGLKGSYWDLLCR